MNYEIRGRARIQSILYIFVSLKQHVPVYVSIENDIGVPILAAANAINADYLSRLGQMSERHLITGN